MMESIDMPVVVSRVEGLGRLIPGIARQLSETIEKSSGWERKVLADKVAQLHLKVKGGRQRL